ncbi:hypothetical protein [Corynebacterium sp. H78]|uniref:hypothetical protein n=1 Tax=Corynebacterium sp. H78 TaxID=3133417 RepID=UPI0030A295DE
MTAQRDATALEHPRSLSKLQTLTPKQWMVGVALIVVAQLLGRVWVLTGRTFYWDDFIIVGRGAHTSPWSTDFLLQEHDGHLAPLSFLVQGLVNQIAPWQWWLPATLMLVGQALVTILMATALRRIAGRTWVALGALAISMLTPLTLPGSTWWSAGINALPMHIAMAGLTALAIRISFAPIAESSLDDDSSQSKNVPSTQPGRLSGTSLVIAAVGVMLACGFFEKSLAVMPVALMVTIFVAYMRRERIGKVLHRGRTLWLVTGVLTALWAVLYAVTSLNTARETAGTPRMELFFNGFGQLLAGLAGGPWLWDRWVPGQPFAAAPTGLIAIGGMLILLTSAVSVGRDSRAWAPWLGWLVYATTVLLVMTVVRSGVHTSDVLAHTLHYYADVALALGFAIAASFMGINFEHSAPPLPQRTRELILVLVIALGLSSAVSVVTFRNAWREDTTEQWLETANSSLEKARADSPTILDQSVPFEVLLPVAAPANTYSRIFADVSEDKRPAFARVTDKPRMFSNDGSVVDAAVTPVTRIAQGDVSECGTEVKANASGTAQVDIPMSDIIKLGDWVAEFNATASSPMDVRLSLPNPFENDEQTRNGSTAVHVGTELSRRWVAVSGGGNTFRVNIEKADPHAVLCVGAGAIGPLVPANP